jgi:hypothetical protein
MNDNHENDLPQYCHRIDANPPMYWQAYPGEGWYLLVVNEGNAWDDALEEAIEPGHSEYPYSSGALPWTAYTVALNPPGRMTHRPSASDVAAIPELVKCLCANVASLPPEVVGTLLKHVYDNAQELCNEAIALDVEWHYATAAEAFASSVTTSV